MPKGILDLDVYDFNQIPDIPVEWLWQGFLAIQSLTVLAADPKVGKSTMLFALMKAMTAGEEFIGGATHMPEGGHALLFTEESVQLLRQRRDRLGNMPLHIVGMQPGLDWTKLIAYTKWRAQHGCKLVILDTVSRFWPVQNEGDAVQVLQALDPLLRVVRTEQLSLLLIHHTRKTGGAGGNAMRGSNAILGSADIGIVMERITPWDKSNRRRLDSLSRYAETPDTLTIERVGEDFVVSDEGGMEKEVMQLVSFEGQTTSADLADATGKAERTCQKILAEMAGRGILSRTGTGGPRSPFVYTVRVAEEKS